MKKSLATFLMGLGLLATYSALAVDDHSSNSGVEGHSLAPRPVTSNTCSASHVTGSVEIENVYIDSYDGNPPFVKVDVEVSGPGGFEEDYKYTASQSSSHVGTVATVTTYVGKNIKLVWNSVSGTFSLDAVTPRSAQMVPNERFKATLSCE